MFRNGLVVFTVVLLVSQPVWSDDPVRKQPFKQRVSPKVLQEAMNLPEYQGKAPESPQQLLDDLQKLSEKLRKNGDNEGADLLQRFIAQHEQFIKRTAQYSESGEGKLLIHVKAFEANPNDLREGSVFHGNALVNPLKIREELEHLISTGKAKMCVAPYLVDGEACVPIRRFSDGEFTVPLHDGKTATIEIRDFNTVIDVLPTVLAKDRLRLKVHCVCENEQAVGSLRETSRETAKETNLNSSCDLDFGQNFVIKSHLHPSKGHAMFLIFEATPRN